MRMLNSEAIGEREILREKRSHGVAGRPSAGGILGGFSQNRIDQRGGGTLPRGLYQFHRFVNGGSRRNAREKIELVHAQPESDADLRIERFIRLGQVPVDQEIKQALPAQDAESQFGRKPGVLHAHFVGECAAKGFIGVGILRGDAQQHVKSNLSSD